MSIVHLKENAPAGTEAIKENSVSSGATVAQSAGNGNVVPLHYGASPGAWDHFDLVLELTDDLLPVVSDPTANIDPDSTMKDKGKTPSRFNRNGFVVGFAKWTSHTATQAEISRWQKDSRLGICIQTRHVRAIDVDVGDFDEAFDIEEYIAAELGIRLPCRRRPNSSKFLLAFRMDGEFTKRRFKTHTDGNFIEFLANGQQFIAIGHHPSGVRYEWDGGLPDSIPTLTVEQFEALWASLAAVFGSEDSVTVRPGVKPSITRVLEDIDDPMATFLEENWEVFDVHSSGRMDIRCAFEEGHSTDSGTTSTSYYPAGVGGFQKGHFKCLHASCAHRTDQDFIDAVGFSIHGFEVLPDPTPEEAAEQAAIRESNETKRKAAELIQLAKQHPAEYRLDRSDTANVNLMHRYTGGNLKFLLERNEWLIWSGQRWEVDKAKSAVQAATREVGEHYHREAVKQRKDADAPGLPPEDRKRLAKVADATEAWATQCRNHRKITDMQAEAKMDKRFVLSVEVLDRDQYLLGVQNGVVDLRTGTLAPDAREQYVTRRASVDFKPKVTSPRWRKFIEEITAAPIAPQLNTAGEVDPATVGRYTPRPEYARYLQKAIGYSLTGLTHEQKMFIAVGKGGNGKNILLDMIAELLPDYAATVQPALLLASGKSADADAPSAATAALAGQRFAIASEAREGAKLDEAIVKAHTGNKTMVARFLHGNPFTFEVTHKLWLMTNYKPRIDNLDDAMRGRLHILPFDRQWNRPGTDRNPALPEGDKGLLTTLRSEAEGILAWMIEGAGLYFKEGLEPPAEVMNSTRAYFKEQDSFETWLAECCENYDDGERATVLLEHFMTWCRDNRRKAKPDNPTGFADAMLKARIEKLKGRHSRFAVRIKPDDTPLEAPPREPNIDGFCDVT